MQGVEIESQGLMHLFLSKSHALFDGQSSEPIHSTLKQPVRSSSPSPKYPGAQMQAKKEIITT
jgi:hypothetical protein